MNGRRWTSSLAGLLGGVVALVVITAMLASAVSSSHTNETVRSLARQLEDANTQLDHLRADYATAQAESTSARATLSRQNRQLQHKLDVLVAFLRANGLPVPKIAAEPAPRPPAAQPEVAPTVPKAPASRPPKSSPGSPGHTATPTPPTPSATAITDPTCVAVPLLCQLNGR